MIDDCHPPRALCHAAAVLRFYSLKLDGGWRHPAVERGFIERAERRLYELDPVAPSPADRALLREVASLLRTVEPTAYEQTVDELHAYAGPAADGPRDRNSPLADTGSRSVTRGPGRRRR